MGLCLHALLFGWVKSELPVFELTNVIFPMIERMTLFLRAKVVNWPNLAKLGEIWVSQGGFGIEFEMMGRK
ncbi:hypothetical protein H5410_021948 [Solanum commersonii]|uniref:Uncharacterized protein n=1 Tax=Solanum commersonii TaxID=4109 RepID=A0A9J5ZCI0_SOLCO|nr:hypothetical protein H5410_021948 [Solanum commersonii]